MQQFEMSSCDLIILIILIKAIFLSHECMYICVRVRSRCRDISIFVMSYMYMMHFTWSKRVWLISGGSCEVIVQSLFLHRREKVQLSYCIISGALTVQAEQQLISASTPYSSTYTHCSDCTDIFYSRTALICVLIGRCVRRLISSFELDVSGGNLWWILCFVLP